MSDNDIIRLERMCNQVNWTRTITALVTDSIETVVITATIVYLIWRNKKSKEGSRTATKSLSLNVYLQLTLMLAQSVLFLINDIYMVNEGQNTWSKQKSARWAYVITLIAASFFMMQHVLFVGQYLRVTLTIPLTFCLQSDEVVSKRESRTNLVVFAEIISAFLLVASFVIELKYPTALQQLIFTLWILILVLILGISQRRLVKLQD